MRRPHDETDKRIRVLGRLYSDNTGSLNQERSFEIIKLVLFRRSVAQFSGVGFAERGPGSAEHLYLHGQAEICCRRRDRGRTGPILRLIRPHTGTGTQRALRARCRSLLAGSKRLRTSKCPPTG